jgi:hypothetical protein
MRHDGQNTTTNNRQLKGQRISDTKNNLYSEANNTHKNQERVKAKPRHKQHLSENEKF